MEDAARIDSLAPYAALAFLLAGIVWVCVGTIIIRRGTRFRDRDVFGALSTAAYITGAAFLLGFMVWLN